MANVHSWPAELCVAGRQGAGLTPTTPGGLRRGEGDCIEEAF